MSTRSVLLAILRFVLAWIAGALLSLPALTTVAVVLSDSPGYPYVRDSTISQIALLAIIVATIIGVLVVWRRFSLQSLLTFATVALGLYWLAVSLIGTTIWPAQYSESSLVIKSYVLAAGILSYLVADHYSFEKIEETVRV